MSLYDSNGNINCTVVDGSTYVGMYAPDGSWNIVINDGTTYTGLYHASGALNAVVTDVFTTAYASNGSRYVMNGPNGYIIGSTNAGGIPSSMVSNPPDIYVNLKTNQAWLKSTSSTVPADTLISVSRATPATQQDANGNWVQFGNNVLARTSLGASIWESRTNSIRNNTMQGAVVGILGGTGSLPTNWTIQNISAGVGAEVIRTGTESGIDYIDIHFSGTAIGASTTVVTFESSASVPALYGQTWSGSIFTKLVSGSTSNTSNNQLFMFFRNSGGVALTNSSINISTTSNSLGSQRVSTNLTALDPNTAGCDLSYRFSYSIGAVVDMTLRFGWPQLEYNSLLNSSLTAASLVAGGSGGVDGTAIYRVDGGTGSSGASLNVTVSGGSIVSIDSIAGVGSYTVFPPTPTTLSYISGVGSGVTGATVNPIPVSNSSRAASSNPILTSSVAVNRSAEADNLMLDNLPTFGSSWSSWVRATPQDPALTTLNRYMLSIDDGSGLNRSNLYRAAGTGNSSAIVTAGGFTQYNVGVSSIPWSQNVSGKSALALSANDQQMVFNGQLAAVGTGTSQPSGINTVRIGSSVGFQIGNANIEEFAIWFNQRVPNTQLQSMTT